MALGAASIDDERAQKLHAVHIGAERVVALRLRMLKARIVHLDMGEHGVSAAYAKARLVASR